MGDKRPGGREPRSRRRNQSPGCHPTAVSRRPSRSRASCDGRQRRPARPPIAAASDLCTKLGELGRGSRHIIGVIAKLGLEPLQKRKPVGRRAREPDQHLSFEQLADLDGIGLHHRRVVLHRLVNSVPLADTSGKSDLCNVLRSCCITAVARRCPVSARAFRSGALISACVVQLVAWIAAEKTRNPANTSSTGPAMFHVRQFPLLCSLPCSLFSIPLHFEHSRTTVSLVHRCAARFFRVRTCAERPHESVASPIFCSLSIPRRSLRLNPLRAHTLPVLPCDVACTACSSAQPKQPAPQPAPHKPSAAKKAAPEVARATRSRVALSQSRWPANDPPAPPTVTFNSQGLHIVAENSALSSILNQVSTETGAKVEGLSGDERVFGSYGPGQPREVLADLLSGINYNVLIVGDAAQASPLRVVLSPRQRACPTAQPDARPPQQDQDEDYQPPQPEEPPQFFQPPRPPMNEAPNGVPITPQDRLQMMQRRQREMEQQQQQQQQQEQQPPQ